MKKSIIFASLLKTGAQQTIKIVWSMEIKGRLAQLVQSTWFTPKGSGVRLPHRPQSLASYCKAFFVFITYLL